MPLPKPLPQPVPAIAVAESPTSTELSVMWQNSPAAQFWYRLPIDAGSNMVVLAIAATEVQDAKTAAALAQAIMDAGVAKLLGAYVVAVPLVPAAVAGYDANLCVQGQCRLEPTPVAPE